MNGSTPMGDWPSVGDDIQQILDGNRAHIAGKPCRQIFAMRQGLRGCEIICLYLVRYGNYMPFYGDLRP